MQKYFGDKKLRFMHRPTLASSFFSFPTWLSDTKKKFSHRRFYVFICEVVHCYGCISVAISYVVTVLVVTVLSLRLSIGTDVFLLRFYLWGCPFATDVFLLLYHICCYGFSCYGSISEVVHCYGCISVVISYVVTVLVLLYFTLVYPVILIYQAFGAGWLLISLSLVWTQRCPIGLD